MMLIDVSLWRNIWIHSSWMDPKVAPSVFLSDPFYHFISNYIYIYIVSYTYFYFLFYVQHWSVPTSFGHQLVNNGNFCSKTIHG